MKEWDLCLIYANKEMFELDLKLVDKDMENIQKLQGKLETIDGFRSYVNLDRIVSMRIEKLYVYSSMQYHLNQKNEQNQEVFSRVYSKYNEWITKTSWVLPELSLIGKEKIMKFCEEEDLECVRFQMEKIFHSQKYIKPSIVEQAMANYGEALGKFNDLYDQLVIVDNHSKDVELSTKEIIKVNHSNFISYLTDLELQEDRRRVFEGVYKFYEEHKATLATIYNGIMQSELADCKNREYDSILDSHLYRNNIDKNVYLTLIETAKGNVNPLLKYIELRKKYFNLKEYHTYDRFLNFEKSDKEYDYETSKKLVLNACKKMGMDYYEKAQFVLADGRVSVEIQEGKTTGAYSNSTYENGPFILLNHTKKLSDVLTIAHEAGHSIHTLYANEAQPYETANYTIFVAEIASTFNEQVFLDYMLENFKDTKEQIVLLQEAIDGIIGTFYRQTLFADFEYQAHALVENGAPITPTALNSIMKDLYRAYYNIDLDNEPYKSLVWAYIPHFFHTPFYVYQYATSFSASLAIYEKVKRNEPDAFEKYIELLKAGGKDYPIELVKKAGVDLTQKGAFMAVVHRLETLLDTLEVLLKK